MADSYLDILLRGLTPNLPGLSFLDSDTNIMESVVDDVKGAVINNNPVIGQYDTTAEMLNKFIGDLGITDRYIPTSDQATDNIFKYLQDNFASVQDNSSEFVDNDFVPPSIGVSPVTEEMLMPLIANDNNNKTYGGGGNGSPANANSGIGSLKTNNFKPNAPGGAGYGMSPGERRAKYGS
tara:strand:+ start:1393 stop:1932 length:540 start_codon:yes stop_codon:yes gene_type:complete